MAELCRAYQLTSQMVGNWKQQFLAAAPQVFEKSDADNDEQARIAELERMARRLTMVWVSEMAYSQMTNSV